MTRGGPPGLAMRAPGIPRPRTEGTRPAGASPGLVCGLQPGGEAVLAAVCVPQPRQVDRRRGVAHRVLLCRPVTGREVIAPSLVGSPVAGGGIRPPVRGRLAGVMVNAGLPRLLSDADVGRLDEVVQRSAE